jgi:hypothetical protein
MSELDQAGGGHGAWQRPLYTPGGDDALVFLVAFGPAIDELQVSQTDHRVDEIPASLELAVQGPETVAAFLEPPIGELLREDHPELVDAAAATGSCLVIRGTIADPADLHYLRAVIGLATAALDAGAVAIYNLQSFGLFSPSRWRTDIFEPDAPSPADFVVILSSEDHEGDPNGAVWLHTRGMRLFGRPDLSMRGVPADMVNVAGQLVRALIQQQVKGLRIDDGSTMAIGDPIGTISFRHRGHVDDPEFNNTHLEVSFRKETEPFETS